MVRRGKGNTPKWHTFNKLEEYYTRRSYNNLEELVGNKNQQTTLKSPLRGVCMDKPPPPTTALEGACH